MTVDEAADCFQRMLLDAGFNFDRPDPALAWEVFKRFVTVPVDSAGGPECEEVWFEACDSRSSETSPGYFDFVRQFLQNADGGAVFHEQVTAHFTCEPSTHVGIPECSSIGGDTAGLPGTFAAVEASSAFRAGVRFSGWTFEVRVDAS